MLQIPKYRTDILLQLKLKTVDEKLSLYILQIDVILNMRETALSL